MKEEFVNKLKKLVEENPLPYTDSLILPALKLADEMLLGITDEVIEAVASELGVSKTAVEEVARFYAMLHKKRGKYVIRVCTNLSCMVNGAYEVLEEFSKLLGIKPGETTEDGMFTLESFECIGLCDKAPSVLVNDERFECVRKEDVPEILRRFGWSGKTPSA
jgi:NADH:ubiquinone oxidoreductase subunit E